MAHHIHITCASDDQSLAEAIAADLRGRGANVSVSHPIAERFALGGAKAIEQCEDLLLVVSPRAIESAWVQAEIAWALQAQKQIIAVIVEPTSLVDYLFVLELERVKLAGGLRAHSLKALAALLQLDEQSTGSPSAVELSTEAVDEPSLQSLFDEADVEKLFFAAAELANSQPERALFVYRFVLKIAPDYAGGSVSGLVEHETTRLKPIWFRKLAEEADNAANEQDWALVRQILQDMRQLGANDDLIAKIKEQVAALRLSDFYKHVAAAMDIEEWDEVERIISEVAESIDDAELVEEFRTQTREKQLNRLLELAALALKKQDWTAAQDYAERITMMAANHPQAQPLMKRIRQGRIDAYVAAANQAIDKNHWEQAEAIKNELLNLSPDSAETRSVEIRLKSARTDSLVHEARKYIQEKQLAALQEVISVLERIDPLNAELHPFRLYVKEIQAALKQQTDCEALYQQAVNAHAAGRMGAVITFLRHINETCPDFGDPQGLVGEEINVETAMLVRKLRSIPMAKDKPSGVAFSPDGSQLASATHYSGVLLWDVETGTKDATLDKFIARTLTFSPDGTLLASAGGANYVSLWAADGGFLRHITVGQDNITAFSLAFSPGSTALAVGLSDGHVKLFSVDDGKLLATFSGHQPYVAYAVAFAPDGSYMASGGGDKSLRLYQPPELRKAKADAWTWLPRLNQEELGAWVAEPIGSSVYSLVFAPLDDLILAAGRGDGIISFMRGISKGYHGFHHLEAHNGVVYSLAFSPDGSLLMSGGADKTVKIWEMREGKPVSEPLVVLSGHGQEVTSVAFSPDSRFIASASADYSVRLWGLGKAFDDEKPKR